MKAGGEKKVEPYTPSEILNGASNILPVANR